MNLSTFKQTLAEQRNLNVGFELPDGSLVPVHAHVTEVGRVDKVFIDCGGTLRRESTCRLQLWVADDADHRLTAGKLSDIIERAGGLISDELPVEVEYDDVIISQFPLTGATRNTEAIVFAMEMKHTDCLAKEICLPDGSDCCGGSGCC